MYRANDSLPSATSVLKAVVFDFGGVLAEEGFREGLLAIGRKNGQDPEQFQRAADDLIHETGYVTGRAEEARYWNAVRQKTGISGSDAELREEIITRFVLRPEVLDLVGRVRARGLVTAILSDQTNWLDEIESKSPFFHLFHHVFNSYRIGKSKRDPSVFADVCAAMGVNAEETLFVDDNIENVRRAAAEGLRVIHFQDMTSFREEIEGLVR